MELDKAMEIGFSVMTLCAHSGNYLPYSLFIKVTTQ